MTSHERKLKEQRYLDRRADKLKKQGTDLAINILQILPCYVLARQGFGNVRLERFIKELYRYTQIVKDDGAILNKMVDELEHDKGIKFDLLNGDVDNVWRADEGDKRNKIRNPGKGR